MTEKPDRKPTPDRYKIQPLYNYEIDGVTHNLTTPVWLVLERKSTWWRIDNARGNSELYLPIGVYETRADAETCKLHLESIKETEDQS